MTNQRNKRIGAAFCAAAVLIWLFAAVLVRQNLVSAEENLGTLSLWCVKDDDIVVGMHWQIFRVGHRVDDDYVFEGDFSSCRATLGNQTQPMLEWDSETVANAGETLKIFSIVNQISHQNEGWTDASGCVTFEGLSDGLYLVWGDVLYKGDTTYIPAAIFFEMNGSDAAVLNAYPKIVLRTLASRTYDYSVRKVWKNDESQPWNRSVTITVERYRDNVLYDEVVLSDANEWTFEWEEKDGHEWFVHEKVIPPHYTVAYVENHKQYLIVNTYETTESQETTTTDTTVTTAMTSASDISSDSQDTALLTDSSERSTDTAASTVSSTTVLTDEKVPQTGQLWWPVFPLGCGGLLLLGMGRRLSKKENEDAFLKDGEQRE